MKRSTKNAQILRTAGAPYPWTREGISAWVAIAVDPECCPDFDKASARIHAIPIHLNQVDRLIREFLEDSHQALEFENQNPSYLRGVYEYMREYVHFLPSNASNERLLLYLSLRFFF